MHPPFHWPHAPEHRLGEDGAFMVTAGTMDKIKLFGDGERLDALCGGLLKYAAKHRWRLQAWAVFPNHYHFVALSPLVGAGGLPRFLRELHSRSARWLNALDQQRGRKVWHNYWETHLTYDTSYYSRLNYVHQNAVKHGVVAVANQHRWCSAGWFERHATPAQRKTVYGFKIDSVNVDDDF
jgi:putative transposase